MAEAHDYTKLRGIGSSPISPTRAYLGDDHLLLVIESMMGEEYRRFFYRDIQAVIVRKTGRRLWFNLVLGLLFLCCMAFLRYVVTQPTMHRPVFQNAIPWMWSLALFALVLFLLIVNNISGSSVVCHIQTAAVTQRMPMVTRMLHARRFLKQIRARVEAVQGVLTLHAEPPPIPGVAVAASPATPAAATAEATATAEAIPSPTGGSEAI